MVVKGLFAYLYTRIVYLYTVVYVYAKWGCIKRQ